MEISATIDKPVKKRIWEIDCFRGILFLMMFFDHLTYDMAYIFYNPWRGISEFSSIGMKNISQWCFEYQNTVLGEHGSIICWTSFVVVAGISATLSNRNMRHGSIVLGCGVALTVGMYLVDNMFDFNFGIIHFGILTCLGCLILLAPLLKKLKVWHLLLISVITIPIGIYLRYHYFSTGYWLLPFGFMPKGYRAPDYHPLLPHIGFFTLGIALGKLLYAQKKSLFKRNLNIIPLNWLGRHTLVLYFAHQAFLFALLYLLTFIC